MNEKNGVESRNIEDNRIFDQINIQVELESLLDEYNKKLDTYSSETVEKAFTVLDEKRKKIQSNSQILLKNENYLDLETNQIFELMKRYAQDIKQVFIEQKATITHITDVSPKEMIGGKISKSINRANNYETEVGDWVFASSSPIECNPYMVRNSKSGMVCIDKNKKIYIYGDDNIKIQQDKHGNNVVKLIRPNYAYNINPEKFNPVVTMKKNKEGKSVFEFSEEWISEQEVDINDPKQVLGIDKIDDITDVVKNCQILCDVNQTDEAIKIINSHSKKEAINKLFDSIQNGNLRYINAEANINVSPLFNKYINKKQKIKKKQMEFYQGNLEKEENNGNIKNVNLIELSNEELQHGLFHFSLKKDKNSIDRKGLETRIGRNSKGIDKQSSIYFSYGLEGALETWDVWLKWRANRLYSPCFQEENKEIIEKLENGTATEEEKKEYYYKAELWNEEFSSGKYREDKEKMKFLFDFQIDEMQASNYYLLDLKEGEDFSFDEVDVKKESNLKRKDRTNDVGYKIFHEMYGSYSDFESSKVDKWNMNTFLGKQMIIEPNRIKQLTLPNGKNDVLSIITYLHDKYKEITPAEEQVKFDVLDSYVEYVKDKIKSGDLQHFDRNVRIDEHMSISHFHDQKSEEYFEDRTSGIYSTSEYTITPNQIAKKSVYTHIAIKDRAKEIVDKEIYERTHKKEIEKNSRDFDYGGRH